MQDKATVGQTAILIFLSVTTFSIIELPSKLAGVSAGFIIVPLLCAGALFAGVTYFVSTLNGLYGGKSVLSYAGGLVGNAGLKVISAVLLIDFMLYCTYLSGSVTGLISSNFLPKTPLFAINTAILALSAFIAGKGLKTIARLALITGALFLITSICVCITMLICGEKVNILPLFNAYDIGDIKSVIKVLTVPFGGLELILVTETESHKKLPKVLAFCVFLIAMLYALAAESTVSILGINNTIMLSDAFVEGIKATPAPGIERMDVLYLTFGLAGQFCGVAAMFYAAKECFKKLFGLKDKTCVWLLLIGFTVLQFIFNSYTIKIYKGILPYILTVSLIIIPAVLFLITKIKGVSNEKCS